MEMKLTNNYKYLQVEKIDRTNNMETIAEIS